MINFRYHIVSLVAVLVALAAGVILGAGPLQKGIDSAWSGSGGAEGAERLASQLEAAQATVDAQGGAITALGTRAIGTSLKDRQIALVTAPGTSDKDIEDATRVLTNAGASIVGQIGLTEYWDGQDYAPYRETISGPLSTNMPGGATGSADELVGRAIVQVLTNKEASEGLLPTMLTDEATPLITVEKDAKGTAQSIVFIGPRAATVADPAADGDAQSADAVNESSLSVWTGLSHALTGAPQGAVIIGDASTESSPLTQLRGAGSPVATVDGVGQPLAPVTAALVLGFPDVAEGDWGSQEGAEAVLPSLPAVK